MIITRTPYRISFFGGGTDYPAWYKENGGAVLSTTIDKYCYVTARYLPPFFPHKHRIVYSQQEHVTNINDIDHPSVRETIRFSKIKRGLEIHHDGDVPAKSGLGTSSSFTIGLINALAALEGKIKSKYELAMHGIHVEQNMIKENVGSQDQTAAAFGGLNKIEFGGKKEITVYPITIGEKRLNEFQNNLMLFFTDFSRDASTMAKKWIKNTPQNKESLLAMGKMVDRGATILTGNKSLNEFGKLLNESWQLKRSLTDNITNPKIDYIYKTGLGAGAIGGKLLGAGGGGFMLFYAEPEAQNKIKKKLGKLLHVPFKFEFSGSQIIHHTPQTYII